MDLEILRAEIDRIDQEIVELLNQRAAVALQIGMAKSHLHLFPFDADREKAVLENIGTFNKGPLPQADLQRIYIEIIAACRRLQEEQQALA